MSGKTLNETIAALQEVIKSQQVPGKEHEPTPTEYFALISTTLSSGSGVNERLPDLMKVLIAVIPQSSKTIVRLQFKTVSQTLLTILKLHADDDTLAHVAISSLGALLLQQESSEGFWDGVQALKCINELLSFADSEVPKVRKVSHEQLLALLRSHQMVKASTVRNYVADFCIGVILNCSRAAYKRAHYVILFLELAIVHLTEEKLPTLMEYAVRLQICEIPRLTASVYRMFDMAFQSPYYSFSIGTSIKIFQLLVRSRPTTPDMEANTYFCTALSSGVICIRKRDRFAFTSTSTSTSTSAGSQMLEQVVTVLVQMCESEFIQVHCAVGTALKRLLCSVLERKPFISMTQATKNAAPKSSGSSGGGKGKDNAEEENALFGSLLNIYAGLFQLKFKHAWLYVMDATRSILELFRSNGRPHQMLRSMITNIAQLYQAIEMGALEVSASEHMSLGDTLGTALRVCGVATFLEFVPLHSSSSSNSNSSSSSTSVEVATAIGPISSSREWIINLLHSNLKLMPCALADFGNCILPIANEYYALLKNTSSSNHDVSHSKLLRTRVTQLWSLLPQFSAHHVTDVAKSFPRLAPILERLFSDETYPELVPFVVLTLYHLARGVRERCAHIEVRKDEGSTTATATPISPELAALQEQAYLFLPLVLQYVEGISIGETRFQEGVQCIAAWSEIAPTSLITALCRKLLQLVLTTTAAASSQAAAAGGNTQQQQQENTAAAGWMAVMLAIIPQFPPSLVQLLFRSIRPLLAAAETSSVQKRAYSLLLALLQPNKDQQERDGDMSGSEQQHQNRTIIFQLESPLSMLQAVSEALLTCHVSCRTMRFRCMECLLTSMNEQELDQSLVLVFKEILVCQKDANKKSRDGAVEILNFLIENIDAARLLPLMQEALMDTANPVMRSSAVTGLCLLLLAHRQSDFVLQTTVNLLPQIGQLLVDDSSHQTKAVLSFLRVFVSVQDVDTIQSLLESIVVAFTQALGAHKAKFSARCRAIMRKLLHRVGEEALRRVVPDSDVALLDYICRHARRTQRRKAQRDQESRRSRMLGSDSEDSSDDDGEHEDGNALMEIGAGVGGVGGDEAAGEGKASQQGSLSSASMFERMQSGLNGGRIGMASYGIGTGTSIAGVAAAAAAGNREDYRLGARPKAMRVGDSRHSAVSSATGSSVLPTTLDDLLDDQPSTLQSMRYGDAATAAAGTVAAGSMFSGGGVGTTGSITGSKRGRGSSLQSLHHSNPLIPTASAGDDEDQFNVIVTADGKVVVKEREEDNVSLRSAKRDRGSGGAGSDGITADNGSVNQDDGRGNQGTSAAKAESTSKRRKLNLRAPGIEYRAKKAGGDVWKKGMLEPHAFIPLDPRLLSKKHRSEAIGHFGVVVKGGKNQKATGAAASVPNSRQKHRGNTQNRGKHGKQRR